MLLANMLIYKDLKTLDYPEHTNAISINDKKLLDSFPNILTHPSTQHLQYLFNQTYEAKCQEKCRTRNVCKRISDIDGICKHSEQHCISTPHECIACEAARDHKDKRRRI